MNHFSEEEINEIRERLGLTSATGTATTSAPGLRSSLSIIRKELKMREIKFRAWDGEQYWYNVVPSPIPSRTLDACTEIKGFEPEYDNEVDIISGVETIEQYTGLKDKNGKEIYEGDIVEVGTRFANRIPSRYFSKAIVIFRQQAFMVADSIENTTHNEPLYEYSSDEIKVIGNIHENKELLEKGESE